MQKFNFHVEVVHCATQIVVNEFVFVGTADEFRDRQKMEESWHDCKTELRIISIE